VRDAGDVSAPSGPRAVSVRNRLEAAGHGRAATSLLRRSVGKRARDIAAGRRESLARKGGGTKSGPTSGVCFLTMRESTRTKEGYAMALASRTLYDESCLQESD
jgi:hypothetical protein